MFRFILFLSFLTLISMKEGYGSENSSQGSVKDRAKQIQNLLNQNQQKGQQPPRATPRPLPTPHHQIPSQANIQKEADKNEQQQKSPDRPTQPPPSSKPVLRGGNIRHGCQKAPTPGHVRILAIDGGGVRGLIPATVVAQLEKDLGLSVTKIFDVFVGNSAGGMLALLITKPGTDPKTPEFTGAQIVEKIKEISAKIFGGVQKTTLDKAKATVKKAKNLLTTGAQYNPEVLEKIAAEICGNITLSQAVKPTFIATFDLNSETTQILSTALAIRSKLFDFKIADIARATSAAPFYFPVHPLEFTNNEKGTGLKMQLIDGGVGSNNPTLIGLMDVSKEYCTVPTYEVLSLGTGTTKHHFEKKDMRRKGSPLMMLNPTIDGFMSAQSQNADEATKEFLDVLNSFNATEENNYTRLQVYLEKEDKKLDDVRERTTESLSQKAQEIIDSAKYKQTVARLKDQLCKEGVYQKENMHDKMCPAIVDGSTK